MSYLLLQSPFNIAMLLLLTAVCSIYSSCPVQAQKSKSKAYTVGTLTVTPPSGKRAGSIGGIQVKTLLHATSADQAIGLTGRTQGTALEFAMYEPSMGTVLTSWIDGITMKDALKKEWWINGSSSDACLLGASVDGGSDDNEGGYSNSGVYIVSQGAMAISVDLGDYDGLYIIALNCNDSNPGIDAYSTSLRRNAPFIA